MDLPLLLAGPILRRVEPAVVSVWAAFSKPVSVRLLVWEGRAESGRANAFIVSGPTPAVRVGAKLHLVQVTIAIPASDGKSLQADGHCHTEQVEVVFDRGEARLRHCNRLAGHSPGRQ